MGVYMCTDTSCFVFCAGVRHHHHQVRHGYFDFPSPEWDNISTQAKDFITQLLQKDPAARMSATQSINHSWFDTPSGGAIADATAAAAAAAAGGAADAAPGGEQVCVFCRGEF